MQVFVAWLLSHTYTAIEKRCEMPVDLVLDLCERGLLLWGIDSRVFFIGCGVRAVRERWESAASACEKL